MFNFMCFAGAYDLGFENSVNGKRTSELVVQLVEASAWLRAHVVRNIIGLGHYLPVTLFTLCCLNFRSSFISHLSGKYLQSASTH